MSVLDLAIRCSFITSLLALPFFLVGGLKFMRQSPDEIAVSQARLKGMPLVSGLLTVVPIAVVAIYMSSAMDSDRIGAISAIRSAPAESTVFIDRHRAENTGAVLSALKGVVTTGAHHSHPTAMLQIELRNPSGSIFVTLGRDSQYPQEYWVFYAPLFERPGLELGRISTPALDGYGR